MPRSIGDTVAAGCGRDQVVIAVLAVGCQSHEPGPTEAPAVSSGSGESAPIGIRACDDYLHRIAACSCVDAGGAPGIRDRRQAHGSSRRASPDTAKAAGRSCRPRRRLPRRSCTSSAAEMLFNSLTFVAFFAIVLALSVRDRAVAASQGDAARRELRVLRGVGSAVRSAPVAVDDRRLVRRALARRASRRGAAG